MFRTLIYSSSGACDYSVELQHWSYCSWFDVCWSFGVVGLECYPCCRLKVWVGVVSVLQAEGWVGVVSVLQAEGLVGVVSVLQAEAELQPATRIPLQPNLQPATRIPFQPNLQPATRIPLQPNLQPATRIPPQPNHTETPTHIEPRIIRPIW